MRKALWSSAALVMLLSSFLAWQAQAATTPVTMGSDAKPNDFKFFPAEITVPVGSTVQWENKSSIPHDAVAEGIFDSKTLQKGDKFEFTFPTPGEFKYICTEPGHEGAGMTGVVTVTGGSNPAPSSTTTSTTAPTTATTAAGAGSTTTTTTAGGAGATSTTQAASTTPTSAPETAGVTSTTAAPAAGEGGEAAGGDHASSEHKEDKPKNSPLGIAFAAVSTVLLIGISGKLLASKS